MENKSLASLAEAVICATTENSMQTAKKKFRKTRVNLAKGLSSLRQIEK